MKNFDWTSFTLKIAVKSSLHEIYDAWTKASELEKWFLSNVNFFNSNLNIKSKQAYIESGDTYEWKWFLYEGTERGTINKSNGKDYIQFSFAGNCLVDIKLSQSEEFVIIELIQSNIPTDEISKKEIRLGCESGWAFYLVNLKSVYEGGLDLRNKDPKLKGMLNN